MPKAGYIRKAHTYIQCEIRVVQSQSKTSPWCRRRTRWKWSHGVARLGWSAFTSGLAINFKTRHCSQSRSEFLASHELRWNGTAPLLPPCTYHLQALYLIIMSSICTPSFFPSTSLLSSSCPATSQRPPITKAIARGDFVNTGQILSSPRRLEVRSTAEGA